MKVTPELIAAFVDRVWLNPHAYVELTEQEIQDGLQSVLDLLPDVEPFAFTGYPDNPVYLHPSCGTVVDVTPGRSELKDIVKQGECDCENTMPWLRIYVEKRA